MVSTFNEFALTIQSYPLDIVTLSETWLKNHKELLEYVSIPGYATEFRHRDVIKGGGVGAYIKESIKYKRRKDIEEVKPQLEHLWLEIPGKNRNSRLLLGVMYRSERILTPNVWLEHLEDLLSHILVTWDGLIVLTGDMNIDLLSPSNNAITNRYQSLLDIFNLQQVVTLPTRVTKSSSSLIDHIITNNSSRISSTGVIPCSIVSDHDGPFVCINVRAKRFQPRYKYIRNMKTFNELDFMFVFC